MKIYTKILLGMIAGAAIGLLLGPQSSLLDHDFYDLGPAKSVVLLADPADPASALPIPGEATLALDALETVSGTAVDALGRSTKVPERVRVRFEITRQMKLLDGGELERALGGLKVGQKVEAWLPIQPTALEGGGFLVSPQPVSKLGTRIIAWLSPIGALFMRLIQMVIVPLVFSSLLVGVAGLGDVRKLGRLGGKTLILYLGTTAAAVAIGLLVAHAVKPGGFVGEKDRVALSAQFETAAADRAQAAAASPSAVDNLLAIVPVNPIDSLSRGNMLQIIFFALLFGIALTLLRKEQSRPVVLFFDTVQHAMILIIHMVMAVAPFGVAALLAEVIGQSGWTILQALLVYALAVLIGLAFHLSIVYGALVKFVAKLPLLGFLRAARPAQLIAFSTSSSSAALPVTMECAEENLGVSNSISSFVVPLGSTVNMDGTALYQGVAAIFIAQVFGVDLSIGDQLGIVLAATAASIGAAGVPGAGMITLAMVLTAAGIPAVGVALILGVDRILDMFRTAVNVTGDLAVTAVMAVSEGETLRILSPGADEGDPERGFENRLERGETSVEPDRE